MKVHQRSPLKLLDCSHSTAFGCLLVFETSSKDNLMAKKTVRLAASAIKVMNPPPKNLIVCLPVIKEGNLLGMLHSDHLTQQEADAMIEALNKALGGESVWPVRCK